ncbi:MAG: hypothetical protein MJ171_01075 [Clostridia bacterium]|nr:hypothetical protein [Clostridia bacterium]
MAESRCKICGGEIRFKPGSTVGICSSCGASQSAQGSADERIIKMYESVGQYLKEDDTGIGKDDSHAAPGSETAELYNGNINAANVIDESSVSFLLEKAFLLIEDGAFKEADRYLDGALKKDPVNADAYLGKLMTDCHVRFRKDLKTSQFFSKSNVNYLKTIRFGNQTLVHELKEYAECVEKEYEHQSKELDYLLAFNEIRKTNTLDAYKYAFELLTKLGDYRDSQEQARICKEKIEEITALQEATRLRVTKEAEEQRIVEENVTNRRSRIIAIITFICASAAVIYFSFINVILPAFR